MSNRATYMGLGSPLSRVEYLSTASTALELDASYQGALLVWQGQAGAARITLPQPSGFGEVYNFFFLADAVSSATKILANDAQDFYIADGSTERGVANGSTVEGGVGITVMSLSEHRWIADRWGASTIALAAASS